MTSNITENAGRAFFGSAVDSSYERGSPVVLNPAAESFVPAMLADTAPIVPSDRGEECEDWVSGVEAVPRIGDGLCDKVVRLSTTAAEISCARAKTQEAVEVALAQHRVLASELAEARERVHQVLVPPPEAGGTRKQRRAHRKSTQVPLLADASECQRRFNRNWRKGQRLVRVLNRLVADECESNAAVSAALAKEAHMATEEAEATVFEAFSDAEARDEAS